MKKKIKKDKSVMWLVKIPLFDVELAIRVNMSAEEANKETFDRYKVKPAEGFQKFTDTGMTQGQFTAFHCGGYAIWIKDIRNSSGLLHELMHFVQYLYRDRRIPMNEDTEELYAYTIAYVAEQVLKMKIRK
jgi:hypothetical protein